MSTKRKKPTIVTKGGLDIIVPSGGIVHDDVADDIKNWAKVRGKEELMKAPERYDQLTGRYKDFKDSRIDGKAFAVTRPQQCKTCRKTIYVGEKAIKIGSSLVCPVDGGPLEEIDLVVRR